MKRIGKTIYIKILETSDAPALIRLEVNNKNFFRKYTSTREEEFYTFEGQLKKIREEESNGSDGYSFGIYLIETDELIGKLTLSEVLRGSLQSCYIGYYLDKNYNGKGYMTEAVELAVSFAFQELKLHRIEAGVMPHNLGSIKVLEKAGFHKEGIARKNVRINGKWEDHQVLAIINEEWE